MRAIFRCRRKWRSIYRDFVALDELKKWDMPFKASGLEDRHEMDFFIVRHHRYNFSGAISCARSTNQK
jgi:hypothetical protein